MWECTVTCPASMARKPKANPASLGPLKGAEPYAASLSGGNHQGQRHDVAVGELPYFAFDGLGLLQVLDALQVADDDRLLRRVGHGSGKASNIREAECWCQPRVSPCATSASTIVVVIGVLRLRGCFARRTSHSAQDDSGRFNPGRGWTCRSRRFRGAGVSAFFPCLSWAAGLLQTARREAS